MSSADRHAENPFDPAGHHRSPGQPPPRIPLPRAAAEDGGAYPAGAEADFGAGTVVRQEGGDVPVPQPPLEHPVLKSLLGAWALAACSAEEAEAVEEHLGGCGVCADEARRLREAVGLLQRPEPLDLDPGLRTRVLASCLERRPPRIPVPDWSLPYDAEAARLDALLQDFGDSEWHAPVRLRWFEGERRESRRTTVAGVIAHLHAVDGMIAVALGLDDPVQSEEPLTGAVERTEFAWRTSRFPHTRTARGPWRAQVHDIVRTASFTGGSAGGLGVSYGAFELPLRDALLDRAFECWVHADDIAQAVDYPYDPPAPRHLRAMIGLAARLLPGALAERRLAGLAAPGRTRHLVPAGHPGRSLRLEIEGLGGGEWFIPLDSPAAVGSAEYEVAHIALDDVEFCQLAAGHIAPEEAAVGQVGDREAIRDVLFAAAALSRM
ncbi:zf-HC2 domain-containing protein [Streptomyces sp. NPDC004539]|uniref:zf-HC2 domain-containing protein n=1 Tax=Streptomyces sp. NPDC004539 TaxID=3154280 RepID=UPI0033B9441F